LFNIFWWNFLIAGIFFLVQLICTFASPIVLDLFIHYLKDMDTTNLSKGLLYAALLLIFPMLKSIAYHQYYVRVQKIALAMEGCLQTAVFRKLLRISSATKNEIQTGEVVNHLAVDAQRVGMISPWVHFFWHGGLTLIIGCVMIYNYVGPAAFSGITLILLMLPISIWVSSYVGLSEEKLMKFRDERVKEVNEMLLGIRVIKFFAWEDKFSSTIEEIRDKEYTELMKNGIFDLLQISFSKVIPICGIITTFIVYVLLGNELDSAMVFVTLTLFSIIEFPLSISSYFFNEVNNALISGRRIGVFLSAVEHDQETTTRQGDESSHLLDEFDDDDIPRVQPTDIFSDNLDYPIRFKQASFSWEPKKITLENINLDIKRGSLVCIIGPVGSGKSSMLNAIFGYIQKTSGDIAVHGKISYCAQNPWLINATVKDNILFGNQYVKEKYERVVKACQLYKDFVQFPDGDQTEIGENGVTLSGGQRHRISLARACYSDTSIMLLDSPLAAVDVHVGRKLFNDCIHGFLDGKTRVLVTHSLQFLAKSDMIVIMKDGRIHQCGTYDELRKISDFNALMSQTSVEEEGPQTPQTPSNPFIDLQPKKETKILIKNEERLHGDISIGVYYKYFGGYGFYFFLCIGAAIFARVCDIGAGVWLSVWAEKRIELELWQYICVYVLFGLLVITMTLSQQYFFLLGGLKSAMQLHHNMLEAVLRAPMSFFDNTPLGRILVRFAEDQMKVDNSLYLQFNNFTYFALTAISVLILVSFATPPIILLIVPVIISYYFVQLYFRYPFREVKRIVEQTKGPLCSHFAATIIGVSTIKAYQVDRLFVKDNETFVDTHHRARYLEMAMIRWLSTRLEVLSVFIVFGTSLLGVLMKGSLDPALVGLAVAYSLTISENLNWTVRMFILCESGLVNVERIHSYSSLPSEAQRVIKTNRPPKDWPSRGEIVLQNVSMRYSEGGKLVLNNISAVIKPGKTIGIVGRTGSGKSSFLLALFRMVELAGGKIFIDGIDIATIGLKDLRRKISIIPQDPIIFSGTLRQNIDPFSKFSDFEIFSALEGVHLREMVENMPLKLNEPVQEGGSNLSVGEKQLLCLCRALLRKTRIVVLDEATSSVDSESENVVQKAIKSTFHDRTVIAIAHRLETVIDADMIMLMNSGKIEEYDRPGVLLQDHSSLFSHMVDATGKVYSEKLRAIAMKSLEMKSKKPPTVMDLMEKYAALQLEVVELKKQLDKGTKKSKEENLIDL
jgi:ATP-binding cassette subfamily C (CFTR/MRP) protein 1